MINGIILSVFFFFLFLIVHILTFHFFCPERKFRTIAFVAIGSLLAYTATYFIMANQNYHILDQWPETARALGIANALFLVVSGWYIYFYFIVFVYRSITARFMVEIQWNPHKKVHPDELRKSFSFEQKLETEINDMIKIDRIYEKNKYYHNTPKGALHGKIIHSLKNFLRLEQKR